MKWLLLILAFGLSAHAQTCDSSLWKHVYQVVAQFENQVCLYPPRGCSDANAAGAGYLL